MNSLFGSATLWFTRLQVAIEHGHMAIEIGDLAMKHGDLPIGFLSVY